MKKLALLSLLLGFFLQVNAQLFDVWKRQKSKVPPIVGGVRPDLISLLTKVTNEIQTNNGISYKVYYNTNAAAQYRKGILVLGSGNDANSPTVGRLDGAAENALCQKAADNGYVAAIVQYTKGAGVSDWNGSAAQMGRDFDKCIVTLATKFGISKTKSVVGGFSYTSFMLLTDTAFNTTLAYTQGLLAACGSTDEYKASSFKIPVYSIVCAGGYEGNLAGQELYNKIIEKNSSSNVKAKSEGVTDASCTTHCGGNWTDKLYNKMNAWLL